MMLYVSSGFSFDMLPESSLWITRVPISRDEALSLLKAAPTFQSIIRGEAVATILSDTLGIEIPAVRYNVSLGDDDMLLVARPERGRDIQESRSFHFYAVKTERIHAS